MTTPSATLVPTLAADLRAALGSGGDALGGLSGRRPIDRRDRYQTLLTVYDLHTAPLEKLGVAVRHQHHPVVAELKAHCESEWLDELHQVTLNDNLAEARDIVDLLRGLAARDRLPAVYRWLAHTASWDEVVDFLALEGGPDAGFDDLVAACQIGLSGSAKMELAVNYWDEMGNGDPAAVHARLHDDLVAAVAMPRVPLDQLGEAALARLALGGLLATNRWLQPEMLGALGLIELRAGPRCRLVLQAFDRCGAPPRAYPFYEVHAEVDPRHGKDWLEKAIAPTVAQRPELAGRIIRGALWRSAVDAAFLDEVSALLKVTVASTPETAESLRPRPTIAAA